MKVRALANAKQRNMSEEKYRVNIDNSPQKWLVPTLPLCHPRALINPGVY